MRMLKNIRKQAMRPFVSKKEYDRYSSFLNEYAFLSKPKMTVAILKMIGYPKEKSPYNDGTFNKQEMFAIHRYILKTRQNFRS